MMFGKKKKRMLGCILPECFTSMSLRHFKIPELHWFLKISWSVFPLFYSMKEFVEVWHNSQLKSLRESTSDANGPRYIN